MRIITVLFIFLSSNLSAQTIYQKDFEEFWTNVKGNYAYLDKQKIKWDKVREIYQPIADTVQTKSSFIQLLEQVLNELHNGHVSLNVNLASSNRIVPSGSDMLVSKVGNNYEITDLRKGFPAELSGLKVGMKIVKFNGRPIEKQITAFLPKYAKAYNDKMYKYALEMLFAGRHDQERLITVSDNGTEKTFYPDRQRRPDIGKLAEYKILKGNTGYIKINNSLGNDDLIAEFDLILDSLLRTKALILDLTETPGGGNTAVARAIMGRFIEKDLPYQKHEFDETAFAIKRSWVEYVSPRKKTYQNKLVLLVGHWTGSMGEGIAIGFDGMRRTELIGTPMAGLLGAINRFQTTEMKIGYQIPTERLYHINGTPREDFVPAVLTANIYEAWEKVNELLNLN
jgi:C-terminal processing protease CtpA/Prc